MGNKFQSKKAILFFLYIMFVLWVVILSRAPNKREFIPELFWGIRIYITYGCIGLRIIYQYIKNVLLFIPFGLLFPWKSKGGIPVLLCAVVFSSGIELVQYILCRGLSEIDDIVANTVGALIGYILTLLLTKLINRFRKDLSKYE